MTSPHINAPIRARMYTTSRHKVIWVIAVVLSAGLLTPILFFIAAKKGVASFTPAIVYAAITYGVAVLGEPLFGNGGNWIGGVLAITLIVGAAHAAIIDTNWKPDR